MKTCPNCGYQNLDHVSSCRMCQVSLPTSPVGDTNTTTSNPSGLNGLSQNSSVVNPYPSNPPVGNPNNTPVSPYPSNTSYPPTQPQWSPTAPPAPISPNPSFTPGAEMVQRPRFRKPPSRLITAITSIFLGTLGIQKFLLSRPISGVFMILFCWTFIPTFIGILEGIRILCLSETDYNITYRIPIKTNVYRTY